MKNLKISKGFIVRANYFGANALNAESGHRAVVIRNGSQTVYRFYCTLSDLKKEMTKRLKKRQTALIVGLNNIAHVAYLS